MKLLLAYLCVAFAAECDQPISKADMRLSPYKDSVPSADIFLLPVFPAHSKHFYPIYTDSNVMKNYGDGKTKNTNEIDGMITTKAFKNIAQNKPSFWLIITHYGAAGQVAITYHNNEQELSYILSAQFFGRGIATIASKVAMGFIGGKFFATVHPDNKASIAVLNRLGFERDESRVNVSKFNSIRDYYLKDEK